jgi:hypothetical protein
VLYKRVARDESDQTLLDGAGRRRANVVDISATIVYELSGPSLKSWFAVPGKEEPQGRGGHKRNSTAMNVVTD